MRDGADILAARGVAWRTAEGLDVDKVTTAWTADLRYAGQAFELTAMVPAKSELPTFDAETLTALIAEFHRRHETVNGYAMDGHAVELVNLRLSVAAIRPSAGGVESGNDNEPAMAASRPVWFADVGFVETPVRDRASLATGSTFKGPMIVEQMDTTLVIPPAATATVHADGDLILRLGKGA